MMHPPRLAIVVTHPIQYYAPVFRQLTTDGRVLPKVYYTWSQTEQGTVFDPGFGKHVAWDVPVLGGYEHEFVENVARVPGVGFRGIRTPTLRARIEAWEADAILVYGWNNIAHLSAMRHFKGKLPVLFRGDSTMLDPLSRSRALLRRLVLRMVYRYADIAVAVGQNSKDYFSSAGFAERNIFIAPHSVDNDRFSTDDELQQAKAMGRRQDMGIAPGDVVILFAGKLLRKKAPDLLLEAFARVNCPTAHLVLVGDGELDDALRERARTVRNVHFMPFQNQMTMPTIYRMGDLFILPSKGPGETWGLALNEAMACGRAVAASDRVGGARDLIDNSLTGWTFAADDVSALEGVLRRVVSMPRSELGAMGVRAAHRIRRWSTVESADRIADAVVRITRACET